MHMNAACHRRELLRIGALSLLGLPAARQAHAARSHFEPRAKRCLFILLQGGPSHLDLWDPKPEAPQEVRGPFSSIATNLPGLRFGELLPATARVVEHLAVIRSMEHRFTNHIAGTYITLTGSEDQPDRDREAAAEDFPGPGAVMNYLRTEPSSIPTSVSLPNWLSIPGPSNRMPGQYGGFLGGVRDPFLIAGDPHRQDFRPLSLHLPEEVPSHRMGRRWSLLRQFDAGAGWIERENLATHDHLWESAYELLSDPRVRKAVDLEEEKESVRERYGMTRVGQSLLLARRLLEVGVRFVAYNAFNQEWDTHGNLEKRYQQIVPPLDQAYAALIEDLAERCMLDETLVVNTGEFGRTPVVNQQAGRDHWPSAYSTVLAGGGVAGGAVWGASDQRGAYVARDGVAPSDVLATMWHLLGIDPETELRDRLDRPQFLSRGRVLHELI